MNGRPGLSPQSSRVFRFLFNFEFINTFESQMLERQQRGEKKTRQRTFEGYTWRHVTVTQWSSRLMLKFFLEVMLMLRSWCRGGRSRHQLSVFPLWLFRLQLNPETFSMHSLFSWDTSALIWSRGRLCGKAAIRKHFMLNSKQIFRKLIHQKWNQLHAERQPSFFPSSSSLRLSEGCRPSERLASSPQTTTVFICPPASWFICRPPAPPATAAPPL